MVTIYWFFLTIRKKTHSILTWQLYSDLPNVIASKLGTFSLNNIQIKVQFYILLQFQIYQDLPKKRTHNLFTIKRIKIFKLVSFNNEWSELCETLRKRIVVFPVFRVDFHASNTAHTRACAFALTHTPRTVWLPA